jgi:raffinose/stachyose/melibiose transport system permease protein
MAMEQPHGLRARRNSGRCWAMKLLSGDSADVLAPGGPDSSNLQPRASGGHQPRGSLLARVYRAWPLYLALAPTLFLIGVFTYYTTVQGIQMSFYSSNNLSLNFFVGLDNYHRLFSDTYFWNGFKNLLKYFVYGLTVGWFFPFLASELLISLSSLRWQFILRTALLLPMAFPVAVVGFTWQALYSDNPFNLGVINVLLGDIGLGGLAQNWLGDPKTALYCLIFMGFPYIAGLTFLLLLGGLQNIPVEVLEAAAIDGCGRWRRVVALDLPLLGDQFSLLFMLALIGLPTGGSITLILSTNGGPFFSTMVPIVWLIQNGIQVGDYGYAAAMGNVLFVIAVLCSLTFLVAQRVRSRLSLEAPAQWKGENRW